VELKQRLFGSAGVPDGCLNLNQAVPSYPPPDVVLEAAAQAAADPSAAQYTEDAGLLELREAIARHHIDRHGAQVTADEVLVTAGANLVLPGSCCGSTEWRYVRVAVGNTDEEMLREAADRLGQLGT